MDDGGWREATNGRTSPRKELASDQPSSPRPYPSAGSRLPTVICVGINRTHPERAEGYTDRSEGNIMRGRMHARNMKITQRVLSWVWLSTRPTRAPKEIPTSCHGSISSRETRQQHLLLLEDNLKRTHEKDERSS